jgi:hypothetical protein
MSKAIPIFYDTLIVKVNIKDLEEFENSQSLGFKEWIDSYESSTCIEYILVSTTKLFFITSEYNMAHIKEWFKNHYFRNFEIIKEIPKDNFEDDEKI